MVYAMGTRFIRVEWAYSTISENTAGRENNERHRGRADTRADGRDGARTRECVWRRYRRSSRNIERKKKERVLYACARASQGEKERRMTSHKALQRRAHGCWLMNQRRDHSNHNGNDVQ